MRSIVVVLVVLAGNILSHMGVSSFPTFLASLLPLRTLESSREEPCKTWSGITGLQTQLAEMLTRHIFFLFPLPAP